MCGIAGKVNAGAPVDPALLDRMCEALHHRGPDGQGLHVRGPVGLGMRRLAIIDVAGGDQPMYSEDGTVALVCNGEIYNHEALRRELRGRGHSFKTGCDVEVIVHLWEELGARCVERLRGMFAIALWDERRQTLFLARDRVGKKPLVYAHRDDAITFASEVRAVLQDPAVPRDVDPHAIDAFLVNGYVPHGLSALRGLRKLPPASSLIWRPGADPVVERYWRLDHEPKTDIGLEDAAEAVRAAILDATRVRLMSEVPIGAFLSGGVDSSIVVAAMAMTSADTVRTFSVAFPGSHVDESPHARAVAERYGTDHHELEVGPPDASMLPKLAWHFGEPFADPAALPTYQLSELIRRHVVVALNGDGGDESFAGYRRYWQLAMTRTADVLPERLRLAVASAALSVAGRGGNRGPLPRVARLAGRLALGPAQRYASLMRFLPDGERERLYTPAFRAAVGDADPLAHVDAAWAAGRGLRTADRVMAVDHVTYLSDDLLPKVDITSMAHSIEVRSPLLDQELMQLAAGLPVALKLRGRQGKLVLREAARPWLPDGILDRPKQGFEVPLAAWLRGDMRDVASDVLLDPRSVERGWFDPSQLRRLIDEHRAGRDHAYSLWALINLELWHRTCVDAPVARAADLPTLA